jgi:2-phospho-L-lactate transferase/gluconeogenesis factor (CofD/UPF0052 family)
MIITIITGGTGSENIQTELFNINKDISLNLIINGYDDGKSTGIIRNKFKNSLGISDFRKNQILEYKLRYKNENEKIYYLLNHRFTNNTNPYNYIINLIKDNCIDNEKLKEFLICNTDYFFKLKLIENIKYEDFNFMNIIYCSLLHKNNNSIITVCNIIKKILNLKNNIFINSNENLILNGITQNNKILLNEESIVDFNDKNDKIIDIYFDKNKIPFLNKKTEKILLNSDIIICSCGTQFSSLIPTYKTIRFKKTLQKSKAKKYLILNCNYDNDIINYNGDELLDKINEYINLKDINIIISDDNVKELIPIKINYNIINIPKLINNNKHNGFLLWKYILQDYFKLYYNNFYIFDYDYTLYNKDNIELSLKNIKLLENITNRIIITNNCISNLLPIENIDIYSNFGNIKNNQIIINNNYLLDSIDIEYIINKTNKDYNNLKIENRKNISFAIKCDNNRDLIFDKLNNSFNNTSYNIIKTGKTTIEILKKGLSKRNCFIHNNYLNKNYTYITDCNDINYNNKDDKIKYLEVNNIITTNLFLTSIIMNQKYDFCIIVGGINSRMNIKFPKCLININSLNFNKNSNILIKIIEDILPYANNIFICCNNYYKDYFIIIEKNIKYNNIKFLYYNSINNLYNYPYGNAETVYQLLQNEILTKKIFIIWGDILISNNKIFEEMYNLQYNNDFLIPTIYENNPYAYLIIDDNNNVKYIEYLKNITIDFGYHDQCIFLCTTDILKNNIKLILKYDTESNFLDIIKYLKNVKYYITDYSIKSFNTIDELKQNK